MEILHSPPKVNHVNAAQTCAAILDRGQLKPLLARLSRIETKTAIYAIAFQWLSIAIFVMTAICSANAIVYLVCAFFICTRKHALAVIMHDAAHFRLLPSRFWNDLVSDLFLALPMGLNTALYRRYHLEHHQHTNGENDPDKKLMAGHRNWAFPRSFREFLRLAFTDLLGLNNLELNRFYRQWSPWSAVGGSSEIRAFLSFRDYVALSGYLVALISFLYVTNGWLHFLLLWYLPSLFFIPVIVRARAIGDHLGVASTHELNATRTIQVSLLERLLIFPCHINFHLEHHLFPSVPFYNLPKLHKELMMLPEYRKNAHITKGYFSFRHGLLGELCSTSTLTDARFRMSQVHATNISSRNEHSL